jgi:hypothetical protein
MVKIDDLTAMFFNTEESNKRQMETLARKVIESVKIEQNKIETTKKLENIALSDFENIKYVELFYEFLATRPSDAVKTQLAELLKSNL